MNDCPGRRGTPPQQAHARRVPEGGFFASAQTLENPLLSLDQFRARFAERAARHPARVETIPFSRLEQWAFDPETGDLAHASGKFFRVEGIRVTRGAGPSGWDQPIMNQPEVGILGILTRVVDGVRCFLMQRKMEPGNPGLHQLSPTVQATRSNYTLVHRGKTPLYLEYFLDRSRAAVLVDQLQSEQGARFLRKRNRNMIVEANNDVPPHEDFFWLTLGQLKELLKTDFLVNMDSRSVLSCIPFLDGATCHAVEGLPAERLAGVLPGAEALSAFGRDLAVSMAAESGAVHSMNGLISWFTDRKSRCERRTEYRPLNRLERWIRTEREIRHETGGFFSVLAVNVEAGDREVQRWTQPLVAHPHVGLVGYLAQRQNGILHFLVQAKDEPGNFDLVEMAPTVTSSSPERDRDRPGGLAFLDRFLDPPADRIRYTAVHSEEGGRFFNVKNRYMVVEAPEDEAIEPPEAYAWMTLRQIIEFTKHSNLFNIEARGLLACLHFL